MNRPVICRVDLPNTLQVHRSDLDNMSDFLAFQDAITPASGHASHIEQLCAINHVIVCEEERYGLEVSDEF